MDNYARSFVVLNPFKFEHHIVWKDPDSPATLEERNADVLASILSAYPVKGILRDSAL